MGCVPFVLGASSARCRYGTFSSRDSAAQLLGVAVKMATSQKGGSSRVERHWRMGNSLGLSEIGSSKGAHYVILITICSVVATMHFEYGKILINTYIDNSLSPHVHPSVKYCSS